MHLKTLTLKGFKSFAETTVLDLEPGITVVVGPNGSGKSNVVDAVAWVLGAQGPSTLRSVKMEDVIFAGSGRRAALGRAEVSLTMDNTSGRLPVGLAEVTVTRTLWRSGESEYAINGAPCRLLDISELLSDSGVGRSQHLIVSQGQLDGILSSRPEERRLMIEEAAGILKFRRRRERTERRLAATAGDLARLEDLVREVRAQLRPLQRQADAALRHDGLVAESRAIRLYLAGRELRDTQAVVDTASHSVEEQQARLSALVDRLALLDQELGAAEVALDGERVEGHDAEIGELERLRERARGLAALVGERRRSLSRSLESMVDESVVAALSAEAGTLRIALDGANLAVASLLGEQELLEVEVAALEEAREAEGAVGFPQGASALVDGEVASVDELRGRHGALGSALERERQELAGAQGSMATIEARAQEAAQALEVHRARVLECEQAARCVAAALADGEAQLAAAEHASALAESAVRSAEVDLHTWATRADALAMALVQLRARGGAGQLVGLPGALGTLAELVAVDHGWELAFEAALGDAVASVVLADSDQALAALERLAADGASGCVITAPGRAAAYSAPEAHPPAPEAHPPAPEARPHLSGTGGLLAHVRTADPVVGAIMADLLAPVVSVDGGWREGLDLAVANPGTVLVTRAGDRFGPDGWRVGAPGLGATGAALDEARARAVEAAGLLEVANGSQASASAELALAAQTVAGLTRDRESNGARLASAGAATTQSELEHDRAAAEAGTLMERVEALARRVERDAMEVAELEGLVVTAELAEAAAAESDRQRAQTQERLEAQAASLGSRRQELEVRAAGIEERTCMLSARLAEVEGRLARALDAPNGLGGRRQHLERAELVTRRLALVVKAAQGRVESELAEMRRERAGKAARREERTAVIRLLRADRSTVESGLGEARSEVHRADLAHAEARFRHEAALESLRLGLDVAPEVALAASCPELPAGVAPDQRALDLERELRRAGPVNPLAIAELEVVRQRCVFLDSQLADVQAARADLAKLLRAIDTEMVGVFETAYQDVARHFAQLFATLFAGGEGSLCLTDPDNLLETGIEVMARPAGKKVRAISLLSGGEKSLVALAFLFAIFRSRPSPFYLLDEVEAALDDVNLQRFLDLINEFRADAQLIIVSHQRRTMEVADWLYGVSMASGGSSRVVSERTTSSA
ncbi:MAG: chromosome segregation protein SMC [Acidimicrobiales bacterium]